MELTGRLIAGVRRIYPHTCAKLPISRRFGGFIARDTAVRAASTRRGRTARNSPTKKTTFAIMDALDMVKDRAKAKFDETVEMAMMLNVDPRKSNENVRGSVVLPKGSGKQSRVAVFAKGEDAEKAMVAGADVVGAEDLLETVLAGKIDFDNCIATPELMGIVGRAGRVLGPRGLMPNAKVGTVTKDVKAAVTAAKAGQAQFRAGKKGVMHVPVGKVSFDISDLLENVRATMIAVYNQKPEVIKGIYIKQVHLSSTMGKGFRVDVGTVDPGSSRFMLVENPKVAEFPTSDDRDESEDGERQMMNASA